MKTYSEMIKTELIQEISNLGLDKEIDEYAKIPSKPTNAEYVTVLERAAEAKAKKELKLTKGSVKSKSSALTEEEKTTMLDDLSTGVPVIVTDHDGTVTIEDDENRRVVSVTWGNPVIGVTTVNIALHGRMQYLPKGAIMRMKEITLADHIKNEDGKETSTNSRKRFSIADTTGWTEAEFEAHAAEQRLKRV